MLDAAYEVFLERGYERTSMAAVALRAGVTKPVVYGCFPSKEALFAAVRARVEDHVLDVVAAAVRAARGGSPQEIATSGLTAFFRAVADSPNAFRLVYLASAPDPAAEARLGAMRSGLLLGLGRIIEPILREQGSPDPSGRTPVVAQAVIGMAEGAARALLAEPGRRRPEELGALLGALVVRGLESM